MKSISFRKPEWLDSAVGLAGFILSVLSALALLSDKPYFSNEIAVAAALATGLLVLFIAIFFRPRHGFKKIAAEEVEKVSRKLLGSTDEVIFVNPSRNGELSGQLLVAAMDIGTAISVVADAALLHNVLTCVSEIDEGKFFKSARVTGSSTEEFLICFVHQKRKKVSIIFVTPSRAYLFTLIDPALVSLIAGILKRENHNIAGYIGLDSVASPRKIISVIHDEQERYLRNFQSLQKGYISFYGTEVQSVQAGWVESGDFKNIDTLDITTRPDRLLSRHRYNAANRIFVENGGVIRRVYMARDFDLQNQKFKTDLVELFKMQTEIGVQIGLAILDELPQHLRKDFILYDDSIVLIEDQQASSDYTLGRSTAYFGADELERHRSDFDAMWSGRITGIKPVEFAKRILG